MIGDQDGYNPRFEGTTFENGDKCTAHYIEEDGKRYWIGVDASGAEYETAETPAMRIDLTTAEHWIALVKR